MKRLLFVPLLLAACAPGTASKSSSLPLSEGQVWQYTVSETSQTPRIGTIRVKSPNEPRLNGIVSDDLRYPHEALLFYYANKKQLSLNLYQADETITGCTFSNIDEYATEFISEYTTITPEKRLLGSCTLKRIS